MATFELENDNVSPAQLDRKIKQECIIALKVYDQCRQQNCLTPNILGPARCYKTSKCCKEGEVIKPPVHAASVSIDGLTIRKIIVVNKEMNPFRPGYWDIDLKFVFVYNLTFRNSAGETIEKIEATNIYNDKVSLFGSHGSDIVIGTDMFDNLNETLDSDPFVMVEGKAIALEAELNYCKCHHDCGCNDNDYSSGADGVNVTIGLFAIAKLFRVVSLSVESRGFCAAEECEEVSPLDPCDFFDKLDFPHKIFAPPQKEDFGCDNHSGKPGGCDCDEDERAIDIQEPPEVHTRRR